jgi:hypothetical protein
MPCVQVLHDATQVAGEEEEGRVSWSKYARVGRYVDRPKCNIAHHTSDTTSHTQHTREERCVLCYAITRTFIYFSQLKNRVTWMINKHINMKQEVGSREDRNPDLYWVFFLLSKDACIVTV